MKPNFTIAKIDTKDAVKSVLKIFQVPFTSDMSDSMIFKTKSAQETWMTDQYLKSQDTGGGHLNCAFTFTQFRPFRIGEPFRVKIKWADANRCSYFSYYDAESDKTFYGFITGCYWINRNLTQITYTIDPIQTYMFETIIDGSDSTGKVTIPSCLVERETVNSDKYFQYLMPESITAYQYEVKQTYNLFNLLNSDGTSTAHYYLILAKYYLFGEDVARARKVPITTFWKTTANDVLRWLDSDYEPGGGYGQIKKYGNTGNDNMLYYYVISKNDLAKTLTTISVLSSGNDYGDDNSIAGKFLSMFPQASTSKFSNIVAIIPLPSKLVKVRTQSRLLELDSDDNALRALNASLWHIYSTAEYNTSEYESKVALGTDDECYLTDAAIATMKANIKMSWKTWWWEHYDLVGPDTNLLDVDTPQIILPLDMTDLHNKKTYNDSTVVVKLTGMNGETTLPSSKLFAEKDGKVYLKLYVYACVENDFKIIFSSAPINTWKFYQEDNNYNLLVYSAPLQGIALCEDGTRETLVAQRNRRQTYVKQVMSLLPSGTNLATSLWATGSNINQHSTEEYLKQSRALYNFKKLVKAYDDLPKGSGSIDAIPQAYDTVKEYFAARNATKDEQEIHSMAQEAADKANAANRFGRNALLGVSYALNTGAELLSTAEQLSEMNLAAAQSAGTQITLGNGEYGCYNMDWPLVIISLPVKDSLKQIDNFFNRFGYAINDYKQPSLFNRKCWDYIKTNYMKCDAWAMCPNDAKLAIEQIFNNGIRLHHGKFYEDLTIKNDIATTSSSDSSGGNSGSSISGSGGSSGSSGSSKSETTITG